MNLYAVNRPEADENTEFARWWNAWPPQHRQAKGAARREWYKLKPSKALAGQMTAAVTAQAQGDKWRRGYVPTPANWIRDERWDDYVEHAAAQEAFTLTAQKLRPVTTSWMDECKRVHQGTCKGSLSVHRQRMEQS